MGKRATEWKRVSLDQIRQTFKCTWDANNKFSLAIDSIDMEIFYSYFFLFSSILVFVVCVDWAETCVIWFMCVAEAEPKKRVILSCCAKVSRNDKSNDIFHSLFLSFSLLRVIASAKWYTVNSFLMVSRDYTTFFMCRRTFFVIHWTASNWRTHLWAFACRTFIWVIGEKRCVESFENQIRFDWVVMRLEMPLNKYLRSARIYNQQPRRKVGEIKREKKKNDDSANPWCDSGEK